MTDKVVILGISRGGTTYVRQLFQLHMGLPYRGERVFNEEFRNAWERGESNDNVNEEYESLINKLKTIEGTVVSKDHIQHYMMYRHIMGEEFPFNEVYKDYYKIKLVRTNIKHMAYSVAIALTTGRFFNIDDDTKVDVDLEVYKHNLMEHIKGCTELLLFDADFDQIINYDELSGDQVSDQKMFRPLAATARELPITIKKRPPYQDVINNIDELDIVYNEIVDTINNDEMSLISIIDDNIIIR